MKEITVPGVPNAAFNKHRPMSDLIKKQVEHFKHLEHKLPPDVRAQLPQHGIVTEDDAARYIGPMTRYFLSQQAAKTPAKVATMPSRSEEQGLALAAAAEAPSRSKKQKSAGAKKAAVTSATKRKK